MAQPSALDCIVVGYNDVDFQESLRAAQAGQKYSGAYHFMRTNSVPYEGTRITYMDLLNRAIQEVSGRDPRLHVAKMPSLGAWHLRSYLVQHGLRARVINFFNEEQEALAALLAEKPAVVAITTTFYVDPKPIQEIARFVRARGSDAKIVAGGPHVLNTCEALAGDEKTLGRVLDEMGADLYIVDSQGELTLNRVVSHLRGGASDARGLDDIPNLMFKRDGTWVRTARVVENNDMDVFQTRWEDVAPEHFVPTVTTRTARSCAFACSFCRYPVIAGPLNLNSVDAVQRQFDLFERRGVKQVVIIDDTFNVPLPRFKELLRALAKRKYGFEWYSYFRAANADDECFDLMAESRCGGVFLGIESGDQGVLNAMNKSSRVDRYVKSVQELGRRDIITFASLIVGFPGESDQSVDNTIAFIREAKPTYYRAELYFHGVNAPIHERAPEAGLTGAGYSWRHRTMDWKAATRHIERMYREIHESIILPLYMFDFWCIPYLVGQGLSKAQIREFARAAGAVLVDDLSGGGHGAHEALSALGGIFRERRDGAPVAPVMAPR